MTEADSPPPAPPGTRSPPSSLRGTIRYLGPGLIVTGSIVGSGELIVTTGLGAKAGFILLWLIVIGCLLKVFVQIELGRYTISEGITTLDAMNRVPGPRLLVSWLVWLWAIMFVSLSFQLAGIVDGIAEVLALSGLHWPRAALSLVVAASGVALLASGKYRLMETLSTLMVFLFTASTVAAVGALQWTGYAVHASDVAEGLSFQLPREFVWAFAAFGITGVGASELVYYPYWCLEKGYARHVGPRDSSIDWVDRARGWLRVMQIDAWTSFGIYTLATAAFYLLGAAILHAQSAEVRNEEMVSTLSRIYSETFGAPGLAIFLLGAFFVLYSTFFVATASNARLFADALSIFRLRRYASAAEKMSVVRLLCVLFPAVNLLILVFWQRQPVSLVFVGALTQAVMLPFLAFLALHVRFRSTDTRLRPGAAGTAFLFAAFISMTAIGIYQAYEAWERVSRGFR